MVDDCFIRRPVDVARINYALTCFKPNTAMFNMEKSFDPKDIRCGLNGFKRRSHGSAWEVSIMCGLWDKHKLQLVLEEDGNPWDIESRQPNHGFDYYINSSGSFIIDWGYIYGHGAFGITSGKWCKEIVPFFNSEGIAVDYSKRGFVD